MLANDQARVKIVTLTHDVVLGGLPGSETHQHLRDTDGAADGIAFYVLEPISAADSGLVRGASGNHIERDHASGRVVPNYAVRGRMVEALLLQVDSGRNQSRD